MTHHATDPLRRSYRAPSLTVHGRTITWGARTYVMGVINVTPDSFSGDGTAGDPAATVALAARLEREGADLLDIGAESTRPGAAAITPEEECARLLPALRAVRTATSLPISVDTTHAAVAEAALDSGADVINDISGLLGDPAMAPLAARRGAPVIAMHNQRGRPFVGVVESIRAGLIETMEAVRRAALDPGRVIIDPGFGFGWQPQHNLEMVRRLPELSDLRLPILLGPSRKSALGLVLDAPVEDRVDATAAAVAIAVAGGADMVRVHDVAAMVRVVRVADAIVRDNWRPQ